MKVKRKPINGLIILTIIAAAMLYSGYLKENPSVNKPLEVFSHLGQTPSNTDEEGTRTPDKFGYIQPRVVDGFNETPIEGAVVVIPETNKSYKTDENGYTPPIKISILNDPTFDKINPKNWGETTLIAYKEGYIEYVLLHIHVWPDQERKGPKILLFPQNSKQLDQPMSIVEGPNQIWVNSLVEKYRP